MQANSSLAVFWTMARILSDADVMLQVQAEISAALASSGGVFSLEMLQQLPFLGYCIKVSFQVGFLLSICLSLSPSQISLPAKTENPLPSSASPSVYVRHVPILRCEIVTICPGFRAKERVSAVAPYTSDIFPPPTMCSLAGTTPIAPQPAGSARRLAPLTSPPRAQSGTIPPPLPLPLSPNTKKTTPNPCCCLHAHGPSCARRVELPSEARFSYAARSNDGLYKVMPRDVSRS